MCGYWCVRSLTERCFRCELIQSINQMASKAATGATKTPVKAPGSPTVATAAGKDAKSAPSKPVTTPATPTGSGSAAAGSAAAGSNSGAGASIVLQQSTTGGVKIQLSAATPNAQPPQASPSLDSLQQDHICTYHTALLLSLLSIYHALSDLLTICYCHPTTYCVCGGVCLVCSL